MPIDMTFTVFFDFEKECSIPVTGNEAVLKIVDFVEKFDDMSHTKINNNNKTVPRRKR